MKPNPLIVLIFVVLILSGGYYYLTKSMTAERGIAYTREPATFNSGGLTFVVRYDESYEYAQLSFNGKRYELVRVPAATGMKFEESDKAVMFWERGTEAIIELNQEIYTATLVSEDPEDTPSTAGISEADWPLPQAPAAAGDANTEEKTEERALINPAALPLGDGKRSTAPKRGYVYSCQLQFSSSAGGAAKEGPWITGDTWNVNSKIAVRGTEYWQNASFNALVSGFTRAISGNGLPVRSPTGIFPVQKDDPAYEFDRNPNTITAQGINYSLPTDPAFAPVSSCVPMGAVGVMLNGVALYNALDGRGDDAVAHEVQDGCNGHPEKTGEYHYHGPSTCVVGAEERNKLIGYALDGFGIYSRFDAKGHEYTNTDLDECHGTTTPVMWNGELTEIYHYVVTQEYPYTVGCFRGTPVVEASINTGPADTGTIINSQSGSTADTPPAEAMNACSNKQSGANCSFATPQGIVSGSCNTVPSQSKFACVPAERM